MDEAGPRAGRDRLEISAQGRNRTTDTGIFSPLLYRLSYLGVRSAARSRTLRAAGSAGMPRGLGSVKRRDCTSRGRVSALAHVARALQL
jgi:hypothetical protein